MEAASPGLRSRRHFLGATAGTLASLALGPVVRGFPGRALAAESPAELSLREASEAQRQGRLSSVDLTRACLVEIDRLQPALNAFITVAPDAALARAQALDAERRAGTWRGPLHGIPVALKDNIDTAGIRTTAGSALFADRFPAADAEVVRRLDAAGVVVLGKLNMDEFAAGGNTTTSYFGPAHNPWKLDRSPGGSSGGAAAAVAARLCFGAVGTDTSGSLRIPASFCGVVGLKPTYGRVSVRGVIPLSWTLDHVGPMARTVEDTALLLQVMAGHDPLDVASVSAPVPDYAAGLRMSTHGLRLGVPRAHFFDKLDPEVAAAVGSALDALKSLGGTLKDVRIPPMVTAADVTIEEMYAYHAEFFAKTPFLYQPTTRRRLDEGSKLLAADYVLARREIDEMRRSVRTVFTDVDLLVTPTVKIQPRTLEEALRLQDSDKPRPPEPGNTAPFNSAGLPAITVPCGFTRAGLPVGLQIVGPPLGEATVLALAHAYEQATPWHQRRPSPASAESGK